MPLKSNWMIQVVHKIEAIVVTVRTREGNQPGVRFIRFQDVNSKLKTPWNRMKKHRQEHSKIELKQVFGSHYKRTMKWGVKSKTCGKAWKETWKVSKFFAPMKAALTLTTPFTEDIENSARSLRIHLQGRSYIDRRNRLKCISERTFLTEESVRKLTWNKWTERMSWVRRLTHLRRV